MSLEVNVTRTMKIERLPIPSHLTVSMGSGEGTRSLETGDVDQATLDAVAKDWLDRFYAEAGKRHTWYKSYTR